MHHQIFYKRLAKFYDLIYASKDYEGEARRVRELILKYGDPQPYDHGIRKDTAAGRAESREVPPRVTKWDKKSQGRDLLEVAAGTGRYLQYLQRWFKCMGVDKNLNMLKISRLNAPRVPVQKADMITLNLPKKFDAIVCLFSSIGYVKTYANLEKTIRNFARHLKPGGIVIIEPWIDKKKFVVGSPHLETFISKDLKIARASVSKKRGDISIIDFHFLIAERGKTVKHFVDRHELGMFDKNKVLKIMNATGLKAKTTPSHFKSERNLYAGIKK